MPNWLGWVVAAIFGSGGLVGLIAPFVGHKLQERRELDKEKREAHAAWVAGQRELCLGLLDVVIRYKAHLNTLRSAHDNPSSRITAKKQFELALQQLPGFDEVVRKVRRELDLEPNSKLQEAIEQFSDAAIAYNLALGRPFSSVWNPVKTYFGKTSADEVNRLAQNFDVSTKELQTAVREYLASVEKPPKPPHVLPLWHRKPPMIEPPQEVLSRIPSEPTSSNQ